MRFNAIDVIREFNSRKTKITRHSKKPANWKSKSGKYRALFNITNSDCDYF